MLLDLKNAKPDNADQQARDHPTTRMRLPGRFGSLKPVSKSVSAVRIKIPAQVSLSGNGSALESK
jgi:hypothetical protein